MNTTKYVFVKRDDGSVVDIPERHVAGTLKLHPTWKVGPAVETANHFLEAPVTENEVKVPEQKPNTLECPLCGKEFKTEAELKTHKTKHK